MKYYEIVIMFNTNYQNEIENLIKYYSDLIINKNGKIYKFEKVGIRNLSYPIKKLNEAYYLIINIESDIILIKELEKKIKDNENIIRYIILKIKNPTTKKSKLSNEKHE